MRLQIVGAGLAGLLAAHAWPRAQLLEASPEPRAEHKALLRFRTDAVSRLTGIDFHSVTVRKGIWFRGKFVQPSIGMANLYAQKVTGALTGDRSIWNLEPVERWIAPENFYEQLLETVGGRIAWGVPFDFAGLIDGKPLPVISTAPLPVVLKALTSGRNIPFNEYKRAPIKVHRYRIPGADVYQTVYFPDDDLAMYRASITGSMLIVECMADKQFCIEESETDKMVSVFNEAIKAFGLPERGIAKLDSTEQKYGKIVPIPDAQRKRLLHELTTNHGIFSLGRFATWRNILLDDVVQDIDVIRRLIRSSMYERALFAS